jgi:Tol biopolymer transport system component
MQIVPPARVKYSALTFSREGNFVYYLSTRQEQTLVEGGDLYQVAVLGGASRKLLEDLDSPIGFSPDGNQFAFIRNRPGQSALMVANADGSGERTIAIRTSPSSFGDLLDGGVAWSPDGKVIATIAREATTRMNVVEIPSGGGAEKPITSQAWYQITRLAWLADGSGLIMTAADALSSALSAQVWLLSYPSGDAQRITNDLNGYIGASLTSDSGVLATVQGNRTSNIWIVPNRGAGQATQITYGAANLAGLAGVAWTPDGRIVYHSTASGAHGIWIMGANGTGQKQLTIGANAGYPAVCPDNRQIVFVSEGAGRAIWKMELDGSHPKQLAQGGFPQCTPDSRWVVYQSGESLWKVPIDGGEPVQLTSRGFGLPAISPDGKWIAAQQSIQIDNPIGTRIAIIPIEGGEPIKVFDVSQEVPSQIRWSPDGSAVTYLSRRDGVVNVWSQPFKGGPSRQLTDFKSDDIFSFDWSRDGRQLLLARGTWSRDVILISSFR